MRAIVWFRQDLRLNDNTALHFASKNHTEVIGLYIIDVAMWKKHDVAASRVDFELRGLQHLQNDLQLLNIPLLIIETDKTHSIPEEIFKLMQKVKTTHLFFNKQYEVNELKRDETVIKYLKKQNIDCHNYDDQVILPPGSILNQQGSFFKVFTPFKSTWLKTYRDQDKIKLLSKPKKQKSLTLKSTFIPKTVKDFNSVIDPKLWPAGEPHAQKLLKNFIANKIKYYDRDRDFPAIDGTSKLSPYLATGMISPRQCFHAALNFNRDELVSGNKGAITWMSELIWRDFYKHVLIAFPRVSMNKPFKLNTEKLPWNFEENKLIAWQQGQTGFPIIDAAMRQLIQTGWMHNRLRMIVAMFFSKNLFFDWRLGEKYFMQHLIDGDLAANNGGWQWCASTGMDAAPYFRIFNPITQSERFDPKGEFIRRFCPELSKLNDRSIHNPYKNNPKMFADYPQPIINLEISRKQALAEFKKLAKGIKY